MTTTSKTIARRAGWSLRRGSYYGMTDNRADRWYMVHQDETDFRPWGTGYRTQREAWDAAAEQARMNEEG